MLAWPRCGNFHGEIVCEFSVSVSSGVSQIVYNCTIKKKMSGKVTSFVLGVLNGIYINSEYPSQAAAVVPEIKKTLRKCREFWDSLEEESRNKTEE